MTSLPDPIDNPEALLQTRDFICIQIQAQYLITHICQTHGSD